MAAAPPPPAPPPQPWGATINPPTREEPLDIDFELRECYRAATLLPDGRSRRGRKTKHNTATRRWIDTVGFPAIAMGKRPPAEDMAMLRLSPTYLASRCPVPALQPEMLGHKSMGVIHVQSSRLRQRGSVSRRCLRGPAAILLQRLHICQPPMSGGDGPPPSSPGIAGAGRPLRRLGGFGDEGEPPPAPALHALHLRAVPLTCTY